jgi:hypothetical protein
MFRSVENTVNEGEVKVEGATPSCLSWAPRQWVVGGLREPPLQESRDAGKHCVTQHPEYSNCFLPTFSSSSWRLPTADGHAEFSVVLSGLLVYAVNMQPLLFLNAWNYPPLVCCRGGRNEISHVGCSNVAMQCAFHTVCVASYVLALLQYVVISSWRCVESDYWFVSKWKRNSHLFAGLRRSGHDNTVVCRHDVFQLLWGLGLFLLIRSFILYDWILTFFSFAQKIWIMNL